MKNDSSPTVQSVKDLQALQEQFAAKARDHRHEARRHERFADEAQRRADALTKAITALNVPARLERTVLLEKEKAVFLIDGSGSMSTTRPDSGSPLKNILAAVEATGAKNIVMFGNEDPVIATVTHKGLAEGLQSGTVLAPALELLAPLLSDGKKRVLNLMTDGDLNDRRESFKAILELVQKNPKLSVNVIVVAATPKAQKTLIEEMMSDVIKGLPEGQTQVKVLNVKSDPQDIIKAVAKALPAKKSRAKEQNPSG